MPSSRHELTDAKWSCLETALPTWCRDPERKDDHLDRSYTTCYGFQEFATD